MADEQNVNDVNVQIPETQPDGSPVKGADGSIANHLAGKHYIDLTGYHDVRAPKKERMAEFIAQGYVVIKEDDDEDLILVGKKGSEEKKEEVLTEEQKGKQEEDEKKSPEENQS